MAHRYRSIGSFSVLTLVAACGSTDSESPFNPPPGGSGGSATAGGGMTSTAGTSLTGGSTSAGQPGTGGSATRGQPSTAGSGGSAIGGAAGGGAPVDCAGITAAGYELCKSTATTCEAVYTNGDGCAAVCAAAGLGCASAAENVDGMCAADTSLPALACDSGHSSDYCICSGPGGGSGGAGGSGGGGGAAGSAGTGGSGGGAAGAAGSGGGTTTGDISINDPVPGFASVQGGTTGGGKNLASAVTVSTMSALQNAAKASGAAIILVEPGNYSGTLTLASNKTIIGKRAGVTVTGNIRISGDGVSNVIIRNLAVRGNPCSTYDECRAGADAVYVGDGAHHVWLDHLDIADGQDGNCDVTQGGDFVTVSWTHFHYTYDKEHRFSNLIAGSDDEPNSVGKLRITYMNSYWGERVDTRQPRGRFGNVHMLNNYHNTGGGQIHGVGKDMALIAENNVYHENRAIFTDMGSPRGWKGMGNEGTASNMNVSQGSVFTIPYTYQAKPASQVVAAVTAAKCGAGNTCTLAN